VLVHKSLVHKSLNAVRTRHKAAQKKDKGSFIIWLRRRRDSSGRQKEKLQDAMRRAFPDQNEEIFNKPEARKIMARIMNGAKK
jgi:hypothetical protein